MTDEPYTNLDLDTAEEMLIVAGKPELAKALRYQAQGVRNLVQGEWGTSFVNALENIMDTRVISVLTSVQQRLDQQIELVQQVLTTAREAKEIAQQALVVSKAGTRGLGKLTKDVNILKKAMGDSQEDRADLRRRIDTISTSQAVFTASMLLSAHAVIVIDLTQTIVSVNQKVLKYFGYANDELIGRPLDILIPNAFRAAHRKYIEAFAHSSDTQRLMADRHEVYGLHKDGSEFSIRAAIVKIEDGFIAVIERAVEARGG